MVRVNRPHLRYYRPTAPDPLPQTHVVWFSYSGRPKAIDLNREAPEVAFLTTMDGVSDPDTYFYWRLLDPEHDDGDKRLLLTATDSCGLSTYVKDGRWVVCRPQDLPGVGMEEAA